MAKLRKSRIHKAICDVCNGNGFVKIMKEDKEPHVHQCWECESTGEIKHEDSDSYWNYNPAK